MTAGSLVLLLIVVVVIALVLYVIESEAPLSAPTKAVLRMVILLGFLLYVLRLLAYV